MTSVAFLEVSEWLSWPFLESVWVTRVAFPEECEGIMSQSLIDDPAENDEGGG